MPELSAARLVPVLLLFSLYSLGAPGPARYLKTSDGVIIYPNERLAGNTRMIRLRVIANNIIRVTASPSADLSERKSLIVDREQGGGNLGQGRSSEGERGAEQVGGRGGEGSGDMPVWDVREDTGRVILKTALLTATIDPETGAVLFTDAAGNLLLKERAINGRSFEPTVFDGTPMYHIRQTFEGGVDDGWYGLGQHQDGVFNYKQGQQTQLFQNNTEVAVPFLISDKHYGILWDNYSLSRVGDVRPYLPMSALKLFSKKGERGWLTATYSNDRYHPDQAVLEKAESDIDYEYLGASRLYLPASFRPDSGVITWEGAIASDFTGEHTFRFSYGGYCKVWLNGQLVLDRWREAWNPGFAVLKLSMAKDKPCPVKIQWTPDGSESYCSFKWLNPVAGQDRNSFSFDSEAGQQSDYYFIYGKDMDAVIAGYRNLTGKAVLLPKWSFGLWQSRERYKTQDEILHTVAEFRKRKIPLDNIVLDWSYWRQNAWGSQEFDAARFPDPDSMIDVLHAKYHTHFMISVWPKFYEGIPAYSTFNKNGWLYPRNVADGQRDWIAQGYVSTFYDAFNPAARKGFWELLNKKLYSKGVDAWWMDASEPDILSNVSPEKRKEQMNPTAAGPAAEYINAYPLENARGIYEGQRSTDTGKRVFLLTRSGFAGSQRYAAAIWSGDIAARWEDMRAQIVAGLNFSLSGLPYWTMDIGGFAVERRYENATGKDLEEWREQMTRWYQFGAFCPLFRVHGQYPYREIFNTAPEGHPAYQSMLYYDQLRYRLLPYIYSLAGEAYLHDYTLMRALVMDFSGDSAVKHISDQFLLGPSFLVNPVCQFNARHRTVYLPAGQGWYDLYSDKYWAGGQWLAADAPYERIPVFVKEGSIVPMGPDLQYSDEKPADPITLYVYTGKDAHFTLYEDEGTNYQYEKGAYAQIPFVYDEATHMLTIGDREGRFSGMLQQRTFFVKWITHDGKGRSPVKLRYKGKKLQLPFKS